MGLVFPLTASVLTFILLLSLYVYTNDRKLTQIPPRALAFSPSRFSTEDARLAARKYADSPLSVHDQLPRKTGRRYIVVGGAGFLGGWIVLQLIERGEDPKNIRVLDIRPPRRYDLLTGPARDVQFLQVDISDAEAVEAAFTLPWPVSDTARNSESEPEVTVFHTAASIRFYERHPISLSKSSKVNVDGTQNVINSARSIGTSALVYTSSGSISIHSSRFLLWPWESEPKHFVQVINDDDTLVPKHHEDFFSNYAVTKSEAERRVRAADKAASGKTILRTGCIRPGNGVFGPGGDMLCGAYLARQSNPTWIGNMVQSFCYVENCALAHLLYEQRLLANSTAQPEATLPDIGGQAFCIADPGPPATYGDVYSTLSTVEGVTFPALSPTLMLLVATVVECYDITRQFLLRSSRVPTFLPPLNALLVNLQPSLFSLVNVHLVFDDSRARLAPEKGGLGYRGGWTTQEGLCKLVDEHRKGLHLSQQRAEFAGIGFGFRRKSSGLGQ